jgi:hypothetical protein
VELLHIIDALEHICDIVDSSFLHPEFLYGHVEIDGAVLRMLDEVDELLGEDGQTVVLSSLS